jgi:hypothetical protein
LAVLVEKENFAGYIPAPTVPELVVPPLARVVGFQVKIEPVILVERVMLSPPDPGVLAVTNTSAPVAVAVTPTVPPSELIAAARLLASSVLTPSVPKSSVPTVPVPFVSETVTPVVVEGAVSAIVKSPPVPKVTEVRSTAPLGFERLKRDVRALVPKMSP